MSVHTVIVTLEDDRQVLVEVTVELVAVTSEGSEPTEVKVYPDVNVTNVCDRESASSATVWAPPLAEVYDDIYRPLTYLVRES